MGPPWSQMVIYAPMAWMKWVEKKMGAIGDFRARGRVFTYVESGLGKLGRFGVCMAVWGV